MMFAVGTGILEGGWEYVIASYVITWLVMGGYTASLWLRWPRGGDS